MMKVTIKSTAMVDRTGRRVFCCTGACETCTSERAPTATANVSRNEGVRRGDRGIIRSPSNYGPELGVRTLRCGPAALNAHYQCDRSDSGMKVSPVQGPEPNRQEGWKHAEKCVTQCGPRHASRTGSNESHVHFT